MRLLLLASSDFTQMFFRGAVLLLIGLSAIWGTEPLNTAAQDPAVNGGGTTLARFGDARALAADPRGRLYVTDAAQDVVVLLEPDGTRRAVIGGSGTRPGAFDEPSDVDPTNGQMLLVADTYNGRVQRFSEEGKYLGALPVGPEDREGTESWVSGDLQSGPSVRGEGRPVAVASNNEGTIYVADARSGVLRQWTELGGAQRAGGGDPKQRSRLVDPTALALGPQGRLYVADAGRGEVLLYDQFGTFVRRLSTPPLPTIRALTMHQERLWIVCADRVVVWNRAREQVSEHPVELGHPLIDVVPQSSALYLLTSKRLIRRSN